MPAGRATVAVSLYFYAQDTTTYKPAQGPAARAALWYLPSWPSESRDSASLLTESPVVGLNGVVIGVVVVVGVPAVGVAAPCSWPSINPSINQSARRCKSLFQDGSILFTRSRSEREKITEQKISKQCN
jgi:hypothetical protein